jgi:6-phosphofructokinase 2
MTHAPILTVTLNPALDVTTSTPRLLPQRKLRCAQPVYDAGGGGVNVSRAIKELGGSSRAFVMLGGESGVHYRAIFDRAGIECEYWEGDGDTRISMTVMETGTGLHFRFVLPGPEQQPGDADRILDALSQSMEEHYRFVVASGSLPPGLPHDFYARLSERARATGAAVILDSSGPALSAALEGRPQVLRINHFEAREFAEGEGAADLSYVELARRLIDQNIAESVVITLGEEGAIAATRAEIFQVRVPPVEVVSSVGAGDSFVAALTLGLAKGWSLAEASRYGAAAAASAVTTEASSLCNKAHVEELFAAATVEPAE